MVTGSSTGVRLYTNIQHLSGCGLLLACLRGLGDTSYTAKDDVIH
jgi:hypothetical protein